MRPRATHTGFRKGQTITIRMRDGTLFDDKFEEKKSGTVILRRAGRMSLNKIRSITIKR